MAAPQQPAKSKRQLDNKRMYAAIWETIRDKPPGEIVQIRCHPSAVSRIIQAVKKEKTADVGIKKKLAMLRPGPLTITHNPEYDSSKKATGMTIINFSLKYDGSKL